MIEEVRIVSKTGLSVSDVALGLGSSEIIKKRKDSQQSLFAGFISASISMFQELENKMINEITYHNNKIIIHSSEKLFYLGLVNVKVPTDVVAKFLARVATKWESEFQLTEGVFDITNEMTTRTQEIVRESVEEEFWWSKPDYTIENNINLIKDAFRNPSGTFYVRFLPQKFQITAVLLWMLPILVSIILGTSFYGLLTVGERPPHLFSTILTILLLWIGTGFLIEMVQRVNFQYKSYILISGIYSIALIPMIILGSDWYQTNIFDPLTKLVENQNTLVQQFASIVSFVIPFNISFFGYLLLTGYGSSFTQLMPGRKYLLYYMFATLLTLALAGMFRFYNPITE